MLGYNSSGDDGVKYFCKAAFVWGNDTQIIKQQEEHSVSDLAGSMEWNAVWKVLELIKDKMIIYNDRKNIWLYEGKLLTTVFNAFKFRYIYIVFQGQHAVFNFHMMAPPHVLQDCSQKTSVSECCNNHKLVWLGQFPWENPISEETETLKEK